MSWRSMLLIGWLMAWSVRAEPPNVVLIMSDDMGYSDLGCFGGEIRTPNLDRLAENGLRFTNFYSENMCWVSRAAMLTGIYHRASLYQGGLHPRAVTLPEVLKADGYQTLMSGKWHLAGKGNSTFPNDRGFDQFYGILGGASSFYAPHALHLNKKNVAAEYADPDYYFTDAISDRAVEFLSQAKKKKPVFLSVAYTAAHWPLHARPADIEAYKGTYAKGWDELRKARLTRMKELGILPDTMPLSPRHPNVPAWKDEANQAWQERRMEVYAAQVTVMDEGIGRIIDTLKKTGRFENTLIFYMIDNGGCHVEYGPSRKGNYLPSKTRDGRPMRPGNLPDIMPGPEDTYQSYGYGWANASNTPFRQFKQFDHEGGIRTPMIAHWPKGIKDKGKLIRSVSHLIDIMPTVLDVANSKSPKESNGKLNMKTDGHSLRAAFEGKALADHETLYFNHAKGRAIRKNGWKLVSEKKKWELYHLDEDPLELIDLAQKMPEKAKALQKDWEAMEQELQKRAKM